MYLFPVHWGIFRPFPSDDIMFSTKFTSLLATFASKGKPEFSMGEEESAFEWERADPNNISHLNIGNHIRMDQGLPNHRYRSCTMSSLQITVFSCQEDVVLAGHASLLEC